MHILVLCDDRWHPARVPREGLSALKDKGFAFDWIEDARAWSPERMADYPLVILTKSNHVSSSDHNGWMTDDVTGGLTAYILPKYYSDSSEVLLYDLAVKPENQRMGIGKKLIQTLKEYCSSKGIQEFFVMAHEEDGHAIEFYRSTGGTGENVVNFLYETGEDGTHQEAL